MSFNSVSRSVLLLLACLGLTSCNVISNSKALTGKSRVTSTPIQKRSDAFDQYAATIRDHFDNERYVELETIASQLRVSKERLPGGAWKLNAFYSGLHEPQSGDDASDNEWQIHLDKLRKWATRTPDSITPHVALADALVNYAWKARGEGFADSVSAEGWRQFRGRLVLAEKELDEGERLGTKCPHWYVPKLRIGLGQGWELDRFDKVFNEGVALEPTYYYLYRLKAVYLLPRWHGEAGDWERFADESYQRVGGKDGAILYYLIGSHLRTYYGRWYFRQSQVSWPRMREGFIELDRAFGVSNERLNEACLLAALAEDRETAQPLFARIGENPDLSVWKSKVNFDVYRAWAKYKPKQ